MPGPLLFYVFSFLEAVSIIFAPSSGGVTRCKTKQFEDIVHPTAGLDRILSLPSQVVSSRVSNHPLGQRPGLTLRAVRPGRKYQVEMSQTQVENVNEADFMTLGRWLMGNTKDMEVRTRPIALPHTSRLTSARCLRPQLTILMAQLGLACKATSRACAKAGIANLFGMAGDQNSSGDDQKKLDVLSNDIFISALVNSGACSVLVSEENEEPIIVPVEKAGRFCVAFDPLDGAP
jgi:hypothetical protein